MQLDCKWFDKASPLSIKTVGLKKQLRGPVHHSLQLSDYQFETNLAQRKKEKTKVQTKTSDCGAPCKWDSRTKKLTDAKHVNAFKEMNFFETPKLYIRPVR